MSSIKVKDANLNDKYMEVSGEGTESVPYRARHDVFIQDQTTRTFRRFFMTEDKTIMINILRNISVCIKYSTDSKFTK